MIAKNDNIMNDNCGFGCNDFPTKFILFDGSINTWIQPMSVCTHKQWKIYACKRIV